MAVDRSSCHGRSSVLAAWSRQTGRRRRAALSGTPHIDPRVLASGRTGQRAGLLTLCRSSLHRPAGPCHPGPAPTTPPGRAFAEPIPPCREHHSPRQRANRARSSPQRPTVASRSRFHTCTLHGVGVPRYQVGGQQHLGRGARAAAGSPGTNPVVGAVGARCAESSTPVPLNTRLEPPPDGPTAHVGQRRSVRHEVARDE